jgi:transcriptional regulator with XRE-family HTH domain
VTDDDRSVRADLTSAIGHTIQVIRTDRGMSRRELAKRAGISYSYLSAIESGTKPPSTKVQMVIADALGVRVHELLAAAEARTELSTSQDGRPAWRDLMESARRTKDAGPTRAGKTGPAQRSARYVAASGLEEPERGLQRTELGALTELRQLLPHLSTDEVELILEIARKLASRDRPQ